MADDAAVEISPKFSPRFHIKLVGILFDWGRRRTWINSLKTATFIQEEPTLPAKLFTALGVNYDGDSHNTHPDWIPAMQQIL
ncbi:MAG TPA: hypothetical protein VGO67_26270 [Verrucomicrobiae bacterium]|jgi:hypothetical protein